jgi:hypothetical protein
MHVLFSLLVVTAARGCQNHSALSRVPRESYCQFLLIAQQASCSHNTIFEALTFDAKHVLFVKKSPCQSSHAAYRSLLTTSKLLEWLILKAFNCRSWSLNSWSCTSSGSSPRPCTHRYQPTNDTSTLYEPPSAARLYKADKAPTGTNGASTVIGHRKGWEHRLLSLCIDHAKHLWYMFLKCHSVPQG